MKVFYKTWEVSTVGLIDEDSPLEFETDTPEESDRNNKNAANPEQLFAAGYAALFGSALQHVLRAKKIFAPVPAIHTTVGMGKNDAGYFALAVDFAVVFKDINPETAEGLVQEAHQICPYPNATRGNIEVTVSSKIEQ